MDWFALLAAALVVGVSKAGFGAGIGIMASPLVALAVGSKAMLGVLLPVLLLGDCLSVVHYTRHRDARNLCLLLPPCAAGIAAGMLVLGRFRAIPSGGRILDAAVGGLCVVFVSVQAATLVRDAVRRVLARAFPAVDVVNKGADRSPPAGPPACAATAAGGDLRGDVDAGRGDAPPGRPAVSPASPYPLAPQGERPSLQSSPPEGGEETAVSGRAPGAGAAFCAVAVAVGFAAGLTSTLSHAAGPVVAMFLLRQKMEKRVFVGTTAWFFLGTNAMKMGPFLWGGYVTAGTAVYLPYLAPAVLAGTILGAWMARRIPARPFNVAVYLMVLVTGVKLIVG